MTKRARQRVQSSIKTAKEIFAEGLLVLGILLTSLVCPAPAQLVDELTFECVAPPANLVSWWPGDGDANDIQDNNPGMLLGGATFITAKVGQGFTFDSNDDRVTIAHNPNLNVVSPGFSVDFWMKGIKNQPESLFLVVDKSHGFNTGWAFQGNSAIGNIGFIIGSGTDFPGAGSGVDVLDGAFHHIAGTWDGSTVRLYVDGVLYPGTSGFSTPANNDRAVNIGFWWGAGTPHRFFRGAVDELEVYSRALSQEEIQTIFNAGGEGKCKVPTAVCGNSVVEEGEQCDDGNTTSGDGCSSTCQLEEAVACTPPPSQMVSWWPGDGNADDIIDDNHGPLQNGATFAPGIVGQAFSLDGVDDRVNAGSGANLDDIAVKTIDAWIKLDTFGGGNAGRIVAKQSGANLNGFNLLVQRSDGVSFNLNRLLFIQDFTTNDGHWATPNGSISVGGFHHIAVVYDRTSPLNDPVIYINGVAQAVTEISTPSGVATSDAAEDLIIGARKTGATTFDQFFDGLIDEVEIFNRALSSAEIQAIFNAGSAGKCRLALPEEVIDPDSPWLTSRGEVVLKLNENGEVIFGTGTGVAVGSVSVAPDGFGWVLGGNDILRISRNGNILGRITQRTGNEYTDVAADIDRNAWAVRSNGVVVKYDAGMRELFFRPFGALVNLTIDADGRSAWVTRAPDTIAKLDPNGNTLFTKTIPSIPVGQPIPMAVDLDGNVWVGTDVFDQVMKLDKDGNLLFIKGISLDRVWDIAVDPQNNVWVTTGTDGRIVKLDTNGNVIFDKKIPVTITSRGQTVQLSGIAIDSKGNAWITTGSDSPNIFKLNSNGDVLIEKIQFAQSTSAGLPVPLFAKLIEGPDNDPPVALCQEKVTASANKACLACVSVDGGSFDLDEDPLTLSQDPDCNYPLGSTLVTLTVDDGRASDSCQGTITVVDDTPPEITCPDGQTVECTSPSGATVSFDVTASDNCSETISPSCTPLTSGSTFPLGNTAVTCTATDNATNQSECGFTVNVVDTQAPVPDSDPLPTVTGECSAEITSAPTAADSCAGSIIGTTPDPLSYSEQGTFTVTWTFNDGGNTMTQTQTVTVEDTTPPEIQCNAPATITPPDTPISFTATATDDCGDVTPEITGFDCSFENPSGKVVDKTESCVVSFAGDTLTITDSGGVGDNITWTVTATDDGGNPIETECAVEVVNPTEPEEVTICHKPGTPAEKTMTIPSSALPEHLGHGDTLGPCP